MNESSGEDRQNAVVGDAVGESETAEGLHREAAEGRGEPQRRMAPESGGGGGSEEPDQMPEFKREWTAEEIAEAARREAARSPEERRLEEENRDAEAAEEMRWWAAVGLRAHANELIMPDGVVLIGPRKGCDPFEDGVNRWDNRALIAWARENQLRLYGGSGFPQGWTEDDHEKMCCWSGVGIQAVQMGVIDSDGVVLMGPNRGCRPLAVDGHGSDARGILEFAYGGGDPTAVWRGKMETAKGDVPKETSERNALQAAFGSDDLRELRDGLSDWLEKFTHRQVEILNRFVDTTEQGLQRVETRIPDLREGEVGELTATVKLLTDEIRVERSSMRSGVETGSGGAGARKWRFAGMGVLVGFVLGVLALEGSRWF